MRRSRRRYQRTDDKQQARTRDSQRIGRAHSKEERSQESGYCQPRREPNTHSKQRERHRLIEQSPPKERRRSTERESNPELACPLAHSRRHRTEQSNGGEQHRGACEKRKQQRVQPGLGERAREQRLEWRRTRQRDAGIDIVDRPPENRNHLARATGRCDDEGRRRESGKDRLTEWDVHARPRLAQIAIVWRAHQRKGTSHVPPITHS